MTVAPESVACLRISAAAQPLFKATLARSLAHVLRSVTLSCHGADLCARAESQVPRLLQYKVLGAIYGKKVRMHLAGWGSGRETRVW